MLLIMAKAGRPLRVTALHPALHLLPVQPTTINTKRLLLLPQSRFTGQARRLTVPPYASCAATMLCADWLVCSQATSWLVL